MARKTRLISDDNFWTMSEYELKRCIKAHRSNGWWYYCYDDKYDCCESFAQLMDAWDDLWYDEDGERMSKPYMSLTDTYWECAANYNTEYNR